MRTEAGEKRGQQHATYRVLGDRHLEVVGFDQRLRGDLAHLERERAAALQTQGELSRLTRRWTSHLICSQTRLLAVALENDMCYTGAGRTELHAPATRRERGASNRRPIGSKHINSGIC